MESDAPAITNAALADLANRKAATLNPMVAEMLEYRPANDRGGSLRYYRRPSMGSAIIHLCQRDGQNRERIVGRDWGNELADAYRLANSRGWDGFVSPFAVLVVSPAMRERGESLELHPSDLGLADFASPGAAARALTVAVLLASLA